MSKADGGNCFGEEYVNGVNDNDNSDTTNAPLENSEEFIVKDVSEEYLKSA